MSTRWYPLYQQGNPQLRVYLPNFWMKLVKPEHNQPDNIVQFHCSMQMTKFDIRNYLEKIYNVHPAHINTRISLGKTSMPSQFVVKEDDVKIAYVVLKKGETFTFPNIFKEKRDEIKDNEERLNKMKETFEHFTGNTKLPGLPSWFRV